MLRLSVVTPEGPVPDLLEREVDEVTVPGAAGEMGLLPGHVPLISASRTGMLIYRRGGERGKVAVGPGFVEADGKDTVDVLVQRAVPGARVDAAQAEREQREADERLKKATDIEAQRQAQADLDWAAARLSAQKAG